MPAHFALAVLMMLVHLTRARPWLCCVLASACESLTIGVHAAGHRPRELLGLMAAGVEALVAMWGAFERGWHAGWLALRAATPPADLNPKLCVLPLGFRPAAARLEHGSIRSATVSVCSCTTDLYSSDCWLVQAGGAVMTIVAICVRLTCCSTTTPCRRQLVGRLQRSGTHGRWRRCGSGWRAAPRSSGCTCCCCRWGNHCIYNIRRYLNLLPRRCHP